MTENNDFTSLAQGEMQFHPAADEFPLFDGKRLQELVDDISANGQREKIKLFRGQILDGRNRYHACQVAGIIPRYESLPEDIDPWAYVWSLNGERRDMTADQRYLIWKSCSEKSEGWARRQREIAEEANRRRAEAKIGNDNAAQNRAPKTTVVQVVQPLNLPKRAVTREAKAAASKTNAGTVAKMDQLANNRPDLAEKVKVGELPAAAAIREMKREAIVAKLEDIGAKEAKAASGVYDVIVLDPPWQMEKIERDVAPNQSAFDYPTMGEGELAALPLPAADDCHVWVWTTHKHLPMALRLLTAWQLKYVCTFVWHKPGGFQPFGLPQYNCEFALYARRGTPEFVDFKAFPVCFNAPRGAHSEKPGEFYDVVRRVTAGRRLDMFNRRAIDGFDGWGNEAS